jgi:PhnB protein
MSVKPIPEGYHSVTPYLIVRGGSAAIEYYAKAIGAQELFRFPRPERESGSCGNQNW